MKVFNLNLLRRAKRPGGKRLLPGLILFVAVLAFAMACYSGYSLWQRPDATTLDAELFAASLALSMLGLGYWLWRLIAALIVMLLQLVARLIAFPVIYIKEQAVWIYLTVTGAGVVVALYQLSTMPNTAPGNHYLYLLLGSGALLALAVLYHLVRHRLAELLAVAAVLPALAAGIYLLSFSSPQEKIYNQVIEMKKTDEGKKDLAGQLKLLNASLAAYEQNRQHSKLWHAVYGEPPVDVAALADFHKAVVLVQMPNKGKEAFDAVSMSLMKNPGCMYTDLSADEIALWKNNSDQARRLLEKLILSGQDGGKGTPINLGVKAEPQPGDRRDPSREPKPGSGRLPNKIL